MWENVIIADGVLLLIGLGLLAVVAVIGIAITSGTYCTRCQKKLKKNEQVDFLGVPMCEPCENIAQFYNGRQ